MVHLAPPGLTPDGFLIAGSLPGWPKPESGKWELRDVYIIDVTPLPAAGDYCYAHKVGYIDKETYALSWVEIYGKDSALEKVWPIYQAPRRIGTGEEVIIPEAYVSTMLNFKNVHATATMESGPIRIDNEVRGDLQNPSVSASASGLGQIMK